MKLQTWIISAVTALLVVTLAVSQQNVVRGQQTKVGPDAKDWNKTVDNAIAFLRTTQDDNGGWSTKLSPGITGIVVTGLLKTGKIGPNDPMMKKALGYITSLVNKEEKHIAGKGNVVFKLKNYVTCVNLMALVEAKRDKEYRKIIGDATKFLKQLQWDDGENKKKSDDFYGGAGYDSRSRPDLSNTQFFLDALKAAGVPQNDRAFHNAEIFVSRCQNFKSEHNDQAWAGRIDDGSFIYTAATGGVTKVDAKLNGAKAALPGYGSMTYAGIKSLIYCGVSKDDPRIKRAFEWVKKNYTVDTNPGMPGIYKDWGLFYYYNTMAKSLAAMEVDYVVDDKGVKHDWRADITGALRSRQQENGSWRNVNHWMENDPNLVSGYALMALSYCRPK